MSDVSRIAVMENTLRVRRAERRLSQKRLAQAAGIGFDRYFRIENEYTEPTTEEQAAIAAALGVVVDVAFPTHQAEVA
jgi:transcriptional regulator with XRE-family HTH domain